MEIQENIKGDVLIFTPKISSLDAKNSTEFKQRIVNSAHANRIIKVVLDLESVHFIDSSGLGCLISILRALNSEGGNLKLAKINKPIQNMFELVSMNKIFDIFTSNELATASFEAQPKGK